MDLWQGLSLAMMGGSTLLSALGEDSQADMYESVGEYNAAIGEQRADMARIRARWENENIAVVRSQGEIKKRILTKEYELGASDIRTVKGISSQSPTVIAMIEEATREYLYDLALVDWETELSVIDSQRQSWMYQAEAAAEGAGAEYDQWAASAQASQARRSSTGSLLTGAAQGLYAAGSMGLFSSGKTTTASKPSYVWRNP